MSRRFWVYIEQEDGKVHPVSWELLGVARELANQVGEDSIVEGILVGHKMEEAAQEALHYGAETVYVLDDPTFKDYLNKPYTSALRFLVKKHNPEVFLVGATTLGRDLAGAVATSLGTGLTADTTHPRHPPRFRRQRDRDHRLPQPQPADGNRPPARVQSRAAHGRGKGSDCP